jgi:hypothetical protein
LRVAASWGEAGGKEYDCEREMSAHGGSLHGGDFNKNYGTKI